MTREYSDGEERIYYFSTRIQLTYLMGVSNYSGCNEQPGLDRINTKKNTFQIYTCTLVTIRKRNLPQGRRGGVRILRDICYTTFQRRNENSKYIFHIEIPVLFKEFWTDKNEINFSCWIHLITIMLQQDILRSNKRWHAISAHNKSRFGQPTTCYGNDIFIPFTFAGLTLIAVRLLN